MIIISLLFLVIVIFGIYNILNLSARQIADDVLSMTNKPKSISQKALLVQGKIKQSKFVKAIKDIQFALEVTNKQNTFSTICFISFFLFVSGVVFSFLIGNYLLMPIFALGFSFIPYAYIKGTVTQFNKRINEELETALSVITSSYVRTENIIMSVEENIDNIKYPVKQVFKEFLGQTKLINSNMRMAIENLKGKINNTIYHEWCDVLMACQEDRTLKGILYPVAETLTEVKIVNGELEKLLSNPKREFFGVLITVYSIIPILYFLNKDWFNALIFTVQGKTVLTISIIVTLLCIVKVIKYTRPIEYRK